MKKTGDKIISMVMGLLVLGVMLYLAKDTAVYTTADAVGGERKSEQSLAENACIVLDAGHGGFDPGKVGINGQKEADINLAIALKVRKYLEANDVNVVMTREDENGLYDDDTENKKVQDMKKRIEIMENAGALATVSIHQNSYGEEYVNGAQVFYHVSSKEGEMLASLLQTSLRNRLNPQNHRQMKANDSYYLLKKSTVPTVIVECGFLSNAREASLLETQEYQDRVAWAICMGIMQFINKN